MTKNNRIEKKHSHTSNIAYLFKRIWNWDKAYLLWYIPSRPLMVVQSLFMLYIPKLIIDCVEHRVDFIKIVLTVITLFTVIFIINLLRQFINGKILSRQGKFGRLFSIEFTEKNMTTDYVNTDNPLVKDKFQRANGDAASGWSSAEAMLSNILSFVYSILGISSYSVIIMTLSPAIIIILIISSVITYLMGKSNIKFADSVSEENANTERKISYIGRVCSDFSYAKDIKIYGMKDWIGGLTRKFQYKKIEWVQRYSFRNFIIAIVTALLTLIRDGVAYIIVIAMFISNKISLGDFTLYFGAIAGFASWLDGIGKSLNKIVHSSIVIGYYREYLEIKNKFNHGIGCKFPEKDELPIEIELNNISYRYPLAEDFILKNINLKIKKREKIAIVGENGAGKTTLVKILCGLYYPSEGDIIINSRRIQEYNIEEYYELFAAVFQDIHLLPVSIEEFICCTSEENVNYDKLNKVIEEAGLKEKISSLENGVKTKMIKSAFDSAIELSGGEKQKLILARALYKDAPCIVCDEPTAALDPIAENNIYQRYNELTMNKTAIYISHRLASTRFCDRIIYMSGGKIEEIGSHTELIQLNGKYAEMFKIQSHYYSDGDNKNEK